MHAMEGEVCVAMATAVVDGGAVAEQDPSLRVALREESVKVRACTSVGVARVRASLAAGLGGGTKGRACGCEWASRSWPAAAANSRSGRG